MVTTVEDHRRLKCHFFLLFFFFILGLCRLQKYKYKPEYICRTHQNQKYSSPLFDSCSIIIRKYIMRQAGNEYKKDSLDYNSSSFIPQSFLGKDTKLMSPPTWLHIHISTYSSQYLYFLYMHRRQTYSCLHYSQNVSYDRLSIIQHYW